MAADLASFTQAVDKVWKTFSTQEVTLDAKEISSTDQRAHLQYIEKKFQEQLGRARSAFLQCFRNHSVVVESEVRRIRQELTVKLDAQYGEKIKLLRKQTAECSSQVSKHKDEIAHLKTIATAQEAFLSAIRHRWNFEQKEKLKEEVRVLEDKLRKSRSECEDMKHQLLCRDELVEQLRGELQKLESKIEYQANNFAEEKKEYDERIRSLRMEMKQREEHFTSDLTTYKDKFQEYKSKTENEIQIQEILNRRRGDALELMEEERQRHIQARTKPSRRIGPAGELECAEGEEASLEQPYRLQRNSRYRVDDMGMDTSWRDYRGAQNGVKPSRRQLLPKFRVMKPTAGRSPRPPHYGVSAAPVDREGPRGASSPDGPMDHQSRVTPPGPVLHIPVLGTGASATPAGGAAHIPNPILAEAGKRLSVMDSPASPRMLDQFIGAPPQVMINSGGGPVQPTGSLSARPYR